MRKLQHWPNGWGHPYQQDPDERVPRQPEVGQPIRLQAIANPKGIFKRVWWRWRLGDGDWVHLEAEITPDFEGEGEQWAAMIPRIPEADQLTYQLWGETQDDRVDSYGEFVVDIRTWISPDKILEVSASQDILHIVYGFSDEDIDVRFVYRVDEVGNLLINHQLVSENDLAFSGEGCWRRLDDTSIWENGNFGIQIDDQELAIMIIKDGAVLLEEACPFKILVSHAETACAIRWFIRSKGDAAYLGLGERFNALNQAGARVDVRVFEQYRHQGSNTYIPIPFFVSSDGYGWFQNMNRRSVVEFPKTVFESLVITQETGDDLDGQTVIFSDPNLEEIVRRFTIFITKPTLPPVWSFGLWMSSNEWYSQAEVNRQVALMKEHRIPATVVVLEAWSDEENYYIWNDAEYEPKQSDERFRLNDFTFPEEGLWPDPKGLTDQLHAEGLKLILWQIPVLKHLMPCDLETYGPNEQHDRDEAYMIEQKYCVQTTEGVPYRVPPIWFNGSLVWDVTSQEAVDWWLGKRQYLLDEIGVDGFKTDGGEHLWGEELQFSDGRTNAEVWNAYPKIYQQHFYDFVNRMRDNNAICFSRSGYIGSQKTPCHWAGDQDSTWDSFRAVILAGKSLGISGVPFWGWDIGGFSGPIPSAELYLRSTAAVAFAPVMQYHSEHNNHRSVSVDRTPWNIQERTGDHRVIPIFRKYANLRMNLLPYLYSEAVFTSNTGNPLFGTPFVRFMDRQCLHYPFQFLCGRYLLVAPVTDPGVEIWSVYLPKGRWVDFWTGEVFEGGRKLEVRVDLSHVPVFVRDGALLPFHLNNAQEFCGELGNNLNAYKTLALVQFGNENPDWHYSWADYVNDETHELRSEKDLSALKKELGGQVNQIVWMKKER